MTHRPPPLDPDRATCEARTGNGPCPLPAGQGTPHLGQGCCSRHGGMLPGHRALAFSRDLLEQTMALPHSMTPVQLGHPSPALDQILRATLAKHARVRPTQPPTERSPSVAVTDDTPWSGPEAPDAMEEPPDRTTE
jgi:hypothetical protein